MNCEPHCYDKTCDASRPVFIFKIYVEIEIEIVSFTEIAKKVEIVFFHSLTISLISYYTVRVLYS